jgi:hypothetical protein
MSRNLETRITTLERQHGDEPLLVVAFDPHEPPEEPSWIDSALTPACEPNTYNVRRLPCTP